MYALEELGKLQKLFRNQLLFNCERGGSDCFFVCWLRFCLTGGGEELYVAVL